LVKKSEVTCESATTAEDAGDYTRVTLGEVRASKPIHVSSEELVDDLDAFSFVAVPLGSKAVWRLVRSRFLGRDFEEVRKRTMANVVHESSEPCDFDCIDWDFSSFQRFTALLLESCMEAAEFLKLPFLHPAREWTVYLGEGMAKAPASSILLVENMSDDPMDKVHDAQGVNLTRIVGSGIHHMG
jgi:hypothetical protein